MKLQAGPRTIFEPELEDKFSDFLHECHMIGVQITQKLMANFINQYVKSEHMMNSPYYDNLPGMHNIYL